MLKISWVVIEPNNTLPVLCFRQRFGAGRFFQLRGEKISAPAPIK